MADKIIKENSLSSTDETAALTANQGKILNEKKVTGSVGSAAPSSSSFSENNAVYFQYNTNTSSSIPQAWLNAIYPVGAIYMSVNSTDPGTLFGGNWTRIQDKFLLAAGSSYSNGATGGAASVSYTPGGTVGNHTLTTNEIPAHYHTPNHADHTTFAVCTSDSNGSIFRNTCASGSGFANVLRCNNSVGRTGTTSNTGGGGAHNHGWTGTAATIATMPPYLVVYMWQRTS